MEYDSLLELVKKRRSTRRFKSDPVPDEYIDKIIEVARWAPSGFNQQPWEFVVIRDKELKGKIVQLVREYNAQSSRLEPCREPWLVKTKQSPYYLDEKDFANAPVFILVMGDTRTQVGLPMAVRYDPYRRESIFNSSLSNAFLYMTLAVASLGLACQWVSASHTPYIQCLIKNTLGIPHYFDIYDMMALGYSAVRPRAKLMRDKKTVVHYDYCGEEAFRTNEEVLDFVIKSRTWVINTSRRPPDK